MVTDEQNPGYGERPHKAVLKWEFLSLSAASHADEDAKPHISSVLTRKVWLVHFSVYDHHMGWKNMNGVKLCVWKLRTKSMPFHSPSVAPPLSQDCGHL